MSVIHATWRTARLTRFGQIEKQAQAEEAARAQQKAEALCALKALLPATEYERMLAECQRGEREVRLENGFVMTCLSSSQ
jgi:hypothetical protein